MSPLEGFTSPGRSARSRRHALIVAILMAATLALCALDIMAGERWYSPSEVWAVATGAASGGAAFSIGQIRLPRAILALLAGLAFGAAGRTSQLMLRNQLASPDIIGITSGSSAAAVIAILVWGWSGMAVNILALVAGLATALLVFLLAGSGSAQGGRLILIGIGMSAMFTAITNYVQLRANIYDIADAMRWLSGSLASASWDQIPLFGVAVLILGAVLALYDRDLGALRLGDEAAAGLGVPVARTRLIMLLALVALVAFASAATGPIAFASFLAGPITARLVGRSDRNLVAASALMGAVLVLGADILAQHAFPTTLPVGVVTGVVGAPYLLLQLLRINARGASV